MTMQFEWFTINNIEITDPVFVDRFIKMHIRSTSPWKHKQKRVRGRRFSRLGMSVKQFVKWCWD